MSSSVTNKFLFRKQTFFLVRMESKKKTGMNKRSPQPQRRPESARQVSPQLQRGLPSTKEPSPKLQRAGLRVPSPQPQQRVFLFVDPSKSKY